MIAGIDIGGTTTHVVVVDDNGTVLGRASDVTPAGDGGDRMIGVAAALIDRLLDDLGSAGGLRGVGVGAAGVIDTIAGTVVAASDSFAGWQGFNIRAALSARYTVPVSVVNDVNAFLIGERDFGAIRGHGDVIALTLGTGVGGAILLGGDLYSGPSGAAGELGHTPGFSDEVCTCGRIGHLETRASGRSVERRYALLAGAVSQPGVGGSAVDARGIAERARLGDVIAVRVFTEAGTAIGQAIVSSCTLLDITTFLIGGGLANAADLLLPAIHAEVARNSPVAGQRVTIALASLGSWSVALGGAAAVRALIADGLVVAN